MIRRRRGEGGPPSDPLAEAARGLADRYRAEPWFYTVGRGPSADGVPSLLLLVTSKRAALAADVPLYWGPHHVPILIRLTAARHRTPTP